MAPRQGEIHWVDLNLVQGREQRGRRPALVLSQNALNSLPLTVLVMVGTGAEHLDAARRYPTDLWVAAAEAGLPKDTVFLGLQLRSVDPGRLVGRVGVLPAERLSEALDIVRYVMGDERPLARTDQPLVG